MENKKPYPNKSPPRKGPIFYPKKQTQDGMSFSTFLIISLHFSSQKERVIIPLTI